MATIDVREESSEVTAITFYSLSGPDFHNLAAKITKQRSGVIISDGSDFVVVENQLHAMNLIKALNKAVELGWLK